MQFVSCFPDIVISFANSNLGRNTKDALKKKPISVNIKPSDISFRQAIRHSCKLAIRRNTGILVRRYINFAHLIQKSLYVFTFRHALDGRDSAHDNDWHHRSLKTPQGTHAAGILSRSRSSGTTSLTPCVQYPPLHGASSGAGRGKEG